MWLPNGWLKTISLFAAEVWFLLIIIVVTKTKAKEMIASPIFRINDKVNNCKNTSCNISHHLHSM